MEVEVVEEEVEVAEEARVEVVEEEEVVEEDRDREHAKQGHRAVAAGGQGGALEQQLLDIVSQQQAAGVEDNDVKPGKPGAKPPQNCVEGTPGCKKRRPALPAKS